MQSFLIPLSVALVRGLALLWLALAPYAAKIEVAAPRSPLEAAVYLVIALTLLGAFGYAVTRYAAQSRMGAALAALAVLEALVLGSVFRGARAPLGRGLIWVFPAVWGAIAFNAAGPLADFAARGQDRKAPAARERVGWALTALVLGVLGVAASYRRLGSAEALLATANKNEPGDEVLALRLAKNLGARGDERAAEATLRACVDANPEACGCGMPVLKSSLDRGAYTEAGAVLVRWVARCRELPRVPGMLAEALAGGGELTAAHQAADIALAKDRSDPYALYAKALLAERAADPTLAQGLLEQSIAAGRGDRALVDLGRLRYQAGDLGAARRLFEAALQGDPNDIAALYDLALVDQIQNRYHDAREGYLKVLRLDPRNLDARFNLAVLTHGVGANGEAKHHQAELEKAAPPGDTRVAALRRLLP
jgi:tetratricopeptide (TPR) repeat protein